MKACRKIRPWLEWLAADELADRQQPAVEAHLRACPACRRELAEWRALLAAAAQRPAALRAEIRSIDWDGVAERIMAGVERQGAPRPRPVFALPWLAAAATLIALIGLGIFFWTRAGAGHAVRESLGPLSPAAAAHLQSGLARGEMISYLQQSQLMLTDLLQDCASDEAQAWEIDLYSRQAKELLLKKKYFQQTLPAADWLKVRSLSERIDWLNYEILQLQGDQFCGQVSRLQRVMERENILLKIRLLEKDLSAKPYQEV
jgi:AcrR family transcriptional regulator